MKKMRKDSLQAIFFDFDGVIIDSTEVKTQGFRLLFQDYGPELVEKVVDYHQLHGGISRVDKIRYAHEALIGKPLVDADVELWAKNYSDLVLEKVLNVALIAGAEEFLGEMHIKLPIFLISGTPEEELRKIVEYRGMNHFFDEILGSPTRKVPHIKMLIEKYRLNTGNCVFIGDAMTDFHAAEQTGIRFIGIESEVQFPKGTCVLPHCLLLKKTIEDSFYV